MFNNDIFEKISLDSFTNDILQINNKKQIQKAYDKNENLSKQNREYKKKRNKKNKNEKRLKIKNKKKK
jgi:hypothetical protein